MTDTRTCRQTSRRSCSGRSWSHSNHCMDKSNKNSI